MRGPSSGCQGVHSSWHGLQTFRHISVPWSGNGRNQPQPQTSDMLINDNTMPLDSQPHASVTAGFASPQTRFLCIHDTDHSDSLLCPL